VKKELVAHSCGADLSGQTLYAPDPASPEQLVVTEYEQGGVAVLVLGGELDVASAPQLARHLEALLDERRSEIVIDVARLEFCDCAGLGVLVHAHRRCVENGGWLRLSAPTPRLSRTLRITRLAQVLVCYPDVESAALRRSALSGS
jgi:anti-sigma B factor antagonist